MFELTLILEIISLIVGLIFFNKIKPTILKLMVFLLLVTIINEASSRYGVYKKLEISKMIFYNSFLLLQFVIISCILINTIGNGKNRFFISYFFVFILLVGIFLILKEGYSKLSPNFISILSIGILCFGFFYLFDIYQSEKILFFKTGSIFWFSIGLIVSNFFLLLFINAIRIKSFNKTSESFEVYQLINSVGNIFYYLCLCYSFICSSIFRKQVGT
jgi:hypothetical protein